MSAKGSAESYGVLRGTLTTLNAIQGDSAYEVAVKNGFVGTEKEWLESLKGKTPVRGEDYFTEEDRAEIINDVMASLPKAEGASF